MRVAILEDDRLMEIDYGHQWKEKILGNIYKGRVEDVLPGLGSAFVDVGINESLFLSQGELNTAILLSHGVKTRYREVPIGKVLRPNQSLILQVRRAGIGSKNAQGTTKISLPGRFWVFLPKEDRIGVSRRVESAELHNRLRRLAQNLKQPGEGMIARTAAQWASKAELERDYLWLAETWEAVEATAQDSSAPKLLYKAMGLVQTVLRDRLLPDVGEVIVDSPFFREKILSFLEYLHMDEYRGRICLYKGKSPLFKHYHVQEQIQETQSPRVGLTGGGFIVIDETEALTVIDVNSGADVKHPNQQTAILNTNLEAATEIARQLRLRKISGIIIIDFIDMEDPGAVQKLIDNVKDVLKRDRVSADFIDLTPLSLMEITRKCEGESLAGILENADFDP